MAAQEAHLETISNNISNGSTVGYKKQRVDFEDLLYQTVRAPGSPTGANTTSPTGLQIGTGVRVVSTSRIFSQGALTVTNNPLDVAIEGDGFYPVQQNDGQIAYTRAGALRTDPQGRIVTPEGLPLDPPITIPPNSTNLSISSNGKVSATMPGETMPADVGQIQTANFINPAGLLSIGHNLFVASQSSGDAQIGEPGADGRGPLLQGSIEQSNVDIVEEMVGLISAQRSYEINSKVITTADDMLRAATQLR